MLTETEIKQIKTYVLVKGVWKLDKDMIMKMAMELLRLMDIKEPTAAEDVLEK